MRKSYFSRRFGGYSKKQSTLRSGLEDIINAQLQGAKVSYSYEKHEVHYLIPAKNHTYTPDFVLANGVIVEAKGIFDSDDRKRHLLIKKQFPHLDIRFVFSNPNNKLYKGSPTTYGMWCTKYGFRFAHKFIPVEWLKERKHATTGLIAK